MEKKKLVIGVIGADVHAVGIQILYHAFTDAGFDVTNLGVMVSQEEYIAAAIETKADAMQKLLGSFGILELVRTGMVALERGAYTIGDETKEKAEFNLGKNFL